MNTFISLLRGINVSGQNRISMAELKSLYESLNLAKIETYVQSGNVICHSAETDSAALERLIEARIKEKMGLDVPVLIRSTQELQQVVDRHPFTSEQLADPSRAAVTFLRSAPEAALLARLVSPDASDDRFYSGERAVYLFCPNGFGRTKLTNTFFEKKLKVAATSRNWKTVTTLLAMATVR